MWAFTVWDQTTVMYWKHPRWNFADFAALSHIAASATAGCKVTRLLTVSDKKTNTHTHNEAYQTYKFTCQKLCCCLVCLFPQWHKKIGVVLWFLFLNVADTIHSLKQLILLPQWLRSVFIYYTLGLSNTIMFTKVTWQERWSGRMWIIYLNNRCVRVLLITHTLTMALVDWPQKSVTAVSINFDTLTTNSAEWTPLDANINTAC